MKKWFVLVVLCFNVVAFSQIRLGDSEASVLEYAKTNDPWVQISDKYRRKDSTLYLEMKFYGSNNQYDYEKCSYVFKKNKLTMSIKWVYKDRLGAIVYNYHKSKPENRVDMGEDYLYAWIEGDNFISIPQLWYHGTNYYAYTTEKVTAALLKDIAKKKKEKEDKKKQEAVEWAKKQKEQYKKDSVELVKKIKVEWGSTFKCIGLQLDEMEQLTDSTSDMYKYLKRTNSKNVGEYYSKGYIRKNDEQKEK